MGFLLLKIVIFLVWVFGVPLALLGVDLKNFKINKICHFANHPYLSAREATSISVFLPLFPRQAWKREKITNPYTSINDFD